ncbi:MAG TPA: ketopantoate reductase family protein [Spirochaetales bacterium]|nr:ketopantoate reductase family protein [Spirochaetales bacterium]
MAEIRDVLIAGAGAVGSALAATIEERLPGTVSILAGAGRAERFRAEGFLVNGRRRDFRLADPARPAERDLVLVAVKAHQLPAAVEELRSQVGPSTLILSLLNGITSEDILAAAFGREKVPYAMILGIDAIREGNATVFSSGGAIHFGEARNPAGAWSEPVSRIASFLGRAGVRHVVPEDMIRSLWYKFMINVGVNQASAVLRATYASFQSLPEAQRVMEAAMREVVALSAALGTGLVPADIEAWYATLAGLGPESKTSMLQDVEAGRKTEVEAFAGTVVELGARAGVPTPVNELLLDMILAIEKGYPGRSA